MILVIVAAGSGKRLRKEIPKCLNEINGIALIEHLKPFMKKFKKVIIVTGFKGELIRQKLKNEKNIFFVKNSKFKKSNMVFSLFCAKKLIPRNNDIVISYSDIIFDPKIYSTLKKYDFTFMPLKTNWLKVWKKRMPVNKIRSDAENLITKNDKIISIGGKILNTYPKYQFMGLMKIKYKEFIFMHKIFKLIKKINIDFTNFINLLIKQFSFVLYYKKTNVRWFEIDTYRDLKVIKKRGLKSL